MADASGAGAPPMDGGGAPPTGGGGTADIQALGAGMIPGGGGDGYRVSVLLAPRLFFFSLLAT